MDEKKPKKPLTTKELTRAEREFAKHYAVYCSPLSAFDIAFPSRRNWKEWAKHGEAKKILRRPHVAALIEEIRDPGRVRAKLTFAQVLVAAEETFLRLLHDDALRERSPIAHAREMRAQIRSLVELNSFAAARGDAPQADNTRREDGVPVSDDNLQYRLEDLSDAAIIDLHRQLERDSSEGDASPRSEEVLGEFRELRERVPPSPASQAPVRGATGRDRGEDTPGDGVHAAGGSQVDVLERVRAGMGGREIPGNCPHCGKPHNGACPRV